MNRSSLIACLLAAALPAAAAQPPFETSLRDAAEMMLQAAREHRHTGLRLPAAESCEGGRCVRLTGKAVCGEEADGRKWRRYDPPERAAGVLLHQGYVFLTDADGTLYMLDGGWSTVSTRARQTASDGERLLVVDERGELLVQKGPLADRHTWLIFPDIRRTRNVLRPSGESGISRLSWENGRLALVRDPS